MAKRAGQSPQSAGRGLRLVRAKSGGGWVLVHPAEAREVAEDLDEVRSMIAAGEAEVAIDELRWLLEVCHELVEGHFLLGKLAVEELRDVPLGRAHFGAGFQMCEQAIKRAGNPAPVLALHPANRPFFDAGRGLAWCLNELGKREMALEVVQRLLACDPADPLGLRSWIDDVNSGGAQLFQLE